MKKIFKYVLGLLVSFCLGAMAGDVSPASCAAFKGGESAALSISANASADSAAMNKHAVYSKTLGKHFGQLCIPTVRAFVLKSDNSILDIPVKFRKLAENTYRIRIAKEDIKKDWRQLRISTPLTQARKGEDGYWFGPDGRLGYFTEDGHRMLMRVNPIPVFGIKKGKKAVFVQIRGLRHDYALQVDALNGKYEVYPRFLFSDDFVPYEDLSVDYKIFEGSEANYSAMARSYRKEQLDSGRVLPLKLRAKGNPELAYTAESIFIKILMGAKGNGKRIEHQTPETEPELRVLKTFDDISRIMEKLRAAGIDKAHICLTGWNTGGHDGRYPTIFPPEKSMGGYGALARMMKKAKELGYHVSGHVCHDDAYTVSADFDMADISKKRGGQARVGGIASGGLAYKMCYRQYFSKYLEKEVKAMKSAGFNGGYHVDVTSAIVPRPCFDKNHLCTSEETSCYMNKIGERLKKDFGMFSSEGPMDNLASNLDNALYVAMPPNNSLNTPLVHRFVPFWQIVYHGIIISNPFYATIDYNYKKTKAHEFPISKALGGKSERRLILCEFGGRPSYYNEFDDNNLSPVKEAFDEFQKLKYLQYEFIDEHKKIAEDVYVTTYSDGSKIIANHSKKDFSYCGKLVKAKDYALFKAENQANIAQRDLRQETAAY